ncbi:MAG TPA: phage portal protein [Anaerolineae bacterium]|nr:phage portal protein [Anaerolineae bacterium]
MTTKAQGASGYVLGGALKTTISLADLDKQFPELFGGATGLSVTSAFAAVSWMFRCVNLRADTLSGLPRKFYRLDSDEPVDQPAPYQDVDLDRLLWLTEAARCLWGVAYWERDPLLHWLNPSTMTVDVQDSELQGFHQSGVGKRQTEWAPDELVYLPLFNPVDDIGPGVAPAAVALRAAGLSKALLQWPEAFFQHGAIPAVLLSTDQTIQPDDPELKRIGAFWRRLFGGVTHAWETAVLGKGLKPTILSAPVKDLAIPELSDEVREDLSACFGIPITMLQQAAANYATAREDRQAYHKDTNFPEAKRICAAVNQQLWKPLGYEFKFLFHEVEAIQQDEVEKSAGISSLMDQTNQQYDARLLTRPRAVFLVEQLWGQMGIEFPENMPDEEPEEPEPAPVVTPENASPGQEPEGEADGQTAPAGAMPPQMIAAQQAMQEAASRLRKDVAKWARKAKRRGDDCAFESDDIPDWAAKTIHHRLLNDPATAFAPFLGDVKRYPIEAEAALTSTVAGIYAANLPAITRAVRGGTMPALAAMNTQLRGALIAALGEQVSDHALAQGAALGWGMEYDDLLMRSDDWARARADQVIALTQRTNETRLQRILADVTAGTTTTDVAEGLVARLFSDQRAEDIAAYEVTGALAEAAHELSGDMRAAGIAVVERWLTAEDERVCEVCNDLDHTTEDVWADQFADGPPAHHGCRCLLSVEYAGGR